jgi:nitroreductase
MTERPFRRAVPIPADQVDYLIATAARAPSVHNTQPWRFKVSRYKIELYADLRRKLRVDPLGREMLISCGAAVFIPASYGPDENSEGHGCSREDAGLPW